VVTVERKQDTVAQVSLSQCEYPIIRAENFSVYYGSNVGVKNITMDIFPAASQR